MRSYSYISNLDVRFPLGENTYNYTKLDKDVYWYYKSEFPSSYSYEYKRGMQANKSKEKSNLIKKLHSLKEMILNADRSFLVSQGSTLYSYVSAEYRKNSFVKDNSDNYIIPFEESNKVRIR